MPRTPTGLRIEVKVDEDRATAAFKAARKGLNKDVKEGLVEAAEEAALPAARARVIPSEARHVLIARATTRDAYITTRGPRIMGRTVGLLEFGGTVNSDVVAGPGKAIPVAPGVFRATATGPRRYKGQHRMTKAVQSRSSQIEAAVAKHVVKKLDRLID